MASDFWNYLGAAMGAMGGQQAGSLMGAQQAGMASGREKLAELQNKQDALRLGGAKLSQDWALQSPAIDLAQRNYALNAPMTRSKQAVKGDILANAQDAQITGLPAGVTMGTVTGGLRPSLFSGNTRALGQLMSQNALQGQQQGDTFAPLTAPAPFDVTPLPQPSALETALGMGSTAGGIASAIGKILGGGGNGAGGEMNFSEMAKAIKGLFGGKGETAVIDPSQIPAQGSAGLIPGEGAWWNGAGLPDGTTPEDIAAAYAALGAGGTGGDNGLGPSYDDWIASQYGATGPANSGLGGGYMTMDDWNRLFGANGPSPWQSTGAEDQATGGDW